MIPVNGSTAKRLWQFVLVFREDVQSGEQKGPLSRPLSSKKGLARGRLEAESAGYGMARSSSVE
jgi:hypothetical protein